MPESPLTTGVDALVELVNQRRTLSMEEAAAAIRVPVRTIEAWASFLEEEGLLRVEYRFTKPFLVAVGAAKALARPEPGVRVAVRQVERPRPSYGAPAAPAPSDVEALLGEAQDALAAGDTARAKAIYSQLQERYTEFPKHVKSEREAMISTLAQLNAALLEEAGTDKESEAAAAQVREALAQVQLLCKKGQRDPALEAFMNAHNAFDKVKATELRLSLTPLMSRAQQALLETERAAASKDWDAQLKRVQTLLDKLDKAIAKQDTQGAFVLYEQLEEAKKAIPPLVAERKTELERRVLPIYERLLTLHLSLAKRELEQKLEMLAAIERTIDQAIAAGNVAEAGKQYELARRAYLSIPDEFFERKMEEQKTLLSYASRLADLELRSTSR
jgi:tetratricopeptide (TPR) repeat protein